MSVVVSISPKLSDAVLQEDELARLVAEIPELRRREGILLWNNPSGSEVHFNIEVNELWSGMIGSDDEYELVERIAECLGYDVLADGKRVADWDEGEKSRRGCALACLVVGGLLVSIATTFVCRIG